MAPLAPTWKDHLRDGYTETLWLNDALTEDLALWRGNTLADTTTPTEGTALADRWVQVDARMNTARNALYKAEAAAPDQTTANQVRALGQQLANVRTAIDARADARLAAQRSPDEFDIAERERISATNLAEARAQLAATLSSIRGLV